MHDVIKYIAATPATVKQIATATKVSESRVREILKENDEIVQKSDGRPAVFSVPQGKLPTPKQERRKENQRKAQEEQDAKEAARQDRLQKEREEAKAALPVCKQCGEHAELKPAGDSEFLKQCTYCPECETTYHNLTGKVLPVAPDNGKRVLKNPQYKIDQKKDHLAKFGLALEYSRTDRGWHVLDLKAKRKDLLSLTADELSTFEPQGLVDKVLKKADQKARSEA